MDKFSNRFLNKWDILTKSIIGFEFEFYTERSYYKLLELLNRELYPINIHGYRKYHSDMKPDSENFKIEPDLSGGYDMIELITGPMQYNDSKIILLKVLNILKENADTNEKCSLHINISFNDELTDKEISDINYLKMILNVDEDMIYQMFPERKNNFYAMSVKNIIPYKDFDFIGSSANIVENNMELPDMKYYGINFNTLNQDRLEFRYIGGRGYHKKTKEILELLDYFIILSWGSTDTKINNEDRKILVQYLNKNINNYKQFKKLDDFIGNFPNINLEIDKNDSIILVRTYYGEIYDEIYDLITNTYSLTNCTINYDTSERMIEVVDANVKVIKDINNIRFIECTINDGVLNNCEFVTCDIKNAHINNSDIKDSDVFNCKLDTCNADQTTVISESYFYGGLLGGEMESGVFRAGKIGEFGIIGDKVKIIKDDDNYFGIKHNDIHKSPHMKGKILKKKF